MQSVLIPFVLGGLLFYALDPAVDRLQKMRLPRVPGAAAMLLIDVTGCGALAYLLQGQALTVIDQLPVGARKLAATLRRTPGGTYRRDRENAAGVLMSQERFLLGIGRRAVSCRRQSTCGTEPV